MLHTEKYFKAGNYLFAKSVAILNSDPLHGILHHATKFQAVIWFAHIS